MEISCSWMGRTLSSVGRQAIAATQREPTSANNVETTYRPSLKIRCPPSVIAEMINVQTIRQGRMNEPSVAEV